MLCVFDVNETLLDVAALDDFFVDLTGDATARQEWFDLMIHTALTLTAAGGYRPFGEIAMACLQPIATAHGRAATPEQQTELGALLGSLPAHPEVAGALGRLHDAGIRIVTLTNSVPAVAEAQLANAGLTGLVDRAYSADRVERLKPAREPYRLVLESEQVDPADAILIAAHGWDTAGAASVGMGTAFVSRDGRFPLPAADRPGLMATDIADVAEQLLNRQR